MTVIGPDEINHGARCGDCTHAAFDGAGVWCKEFKEPILVEKVAESCGLFEREHPVAPVSTPSPVRVPHVRSEQEWYELFHQYLTELRVTLWGHSFVLDVEGEQRAAAWLASVVSEVEGRQQVA